MEVCTIVKPQLSPHYGACLLVMLSLGGCESKPEQTTPAPSRGHLSAESKVHVQSIKGEARVCFRIPAGVYHTADTEQHELRFRFDNSSELQGATRIAPMQDVSGANIVALTVFANEGQKQGALAYWRTKAAPIDIGNYNFFAPSSRSLQTVLIQKAGLTVIRFYPAVSVWNVPDLAQDAKTLGSFFDAIAISCR